MRQERHVAPRSLDGEDPAWDRTPMVLTVNAVRGGTQTAMVLVANGIHAPLGSQIIGTYRKEGRLDELVDVGAILREVGEDATLDIGIWHPEKLVEFIEGRGDALRVLDHAPRDGVLQRFALLVESFVKPILRTGSCGARADRIDLEAPTDTEMRALRRQTGAGTMSYPMCRAPLDFWTPPVSIEEWVEEAGQLERLLMREMPAGRRSSVYRDCAISTCSYAAMLCGTHDVRNHLIDMVEDVIVRYWQSYARAALQRDKEAARRAIVAAGGWVPGRDVEVPEPRHDSLQAAFIEARQRCRFAFDEGVAPLVFEIQDDIIVANVRLPQSGSTLTTIGATQLGDDDPEGRAARRRPVLHPAI